MRAGEIIVQPVNDPLREKCPRVILSAHKREELWFTIDERYQEITKDEPGLQKYQIYNRISAKSVEWLGVCLGPRQVEGKHARTKDF